MKMTDMVKIYNSIVMLISHSEGVHGYSAYYRRHLLDPDHRNYVSYMGGARKDIVDRFLHDYNIGSAEALELYDTDPGSNTGTSVKLYISNNTNINGLSDKKKTIDLYFGHRFEEVKAELILFVPKTRFLLLFKQAEMQEAFNTYKEIFTKIATVFDDVESGFPSAVHILTGKLFALLFFDWMIECDINKLDDGLGGKLIKYYKEFQRSSYGISNSGTGCIGDQYIESLAIGFDDIIIRLTVFAALEGV